MTRGRLLQPDNGGRSERFQEKNGLGCIKADDFKKSVAG
jgi:hypothetical protein